MTEVERLKERIKSLEGGCCRFNCRTERQAFIIGYDDGWMDGMERNPDWNPQLAYKEWKSEE